MAGLRGTGPHRLARPRTSGSQPEDTGSNPVGAASAQKATGKEARGRDN